MFPEHTAFTIPIRVMGFKVQYEPELIEPLRKLDAFFLQGTSSTNDTYAYFSSKLDPLLPDIRPVTRKV